MVYVDLATKLVTVDVLMLYDRSKARAESGDQLLQSFATTSLQDRPRPEWVYADSGKGFDCTVFREFCGSVRCGLVLTPGHRLHGHMELRSERCSGSSGATAS